MSKKRSGPRMASILVAIGVIIILVLAVVCAQELGA